ncbi:MULTISPECIES: VOC family protein [Halomonadaceae]|jgi:predicted enzyme related to lactoylglutathione lyase|uniref:VOC family protein n=1 Tax=Halomonadaceae TaxID=28256 RepID=UPI0012F2BDED|nr:MULTISPECIES: VOC family protein [Halomonas]CAD5271206.1 Glyoxalase [Halomonas sp. 156]CAD5279343.1 Glyoxalase [Halomonas sp. 113]CAD5280775.1 Glyoxalase [Halomonas sp. 59]CAD5286912.1 Glyoxalase [Halomonas sp. I3]VXB07331.1 Glyoxalase [Halomonas titanicae]
MQFIVNIDVEDIGKAITFYENGLGLQLIRRLFGGMVAEMGGGPASIYLIEQPDASVAAPDTSLQRDYKRHWTPVHLDFIVEDIDSAVEQVVSVGAVQEGGIKSFDWGMLATMSDPFGNGFCLLAFAEGGYDHVE